MCPFIVQLKSLFFWLLACCKAIVTPLRSTTALRDMDQKWSRRTHAPDSCMSPPLPCRGPRDISQQRKRKLVRGPRGHAGNTKLGVSYWQRERNVKRLRGWLNRRSTLVVKTLSFASGSSQFRHQLSIKLKRSFKEMAQKQGMDPWVKDGRQKHPR